MVVLFKSLHVSLKYFLHRLLDTFSHHFVKFITSGSFLASILYVSLHIQDCFSYEFDSFS